MSTFIFRTLLWIFLLFTFFAISPASASTVPAFRNCLSDVERTTSKGLNDKVPCQELTLFDVSYGDEIETLESAWASLEISEDVLIELGENSTGEIFEPTSGSDLKMKRGRVRVFLGRSLGKVFSLEYLDWAVSATGTIFELLIYGDKWARVRVMEGHVSIDSLEGDNLLLEEGQQALLPPHGKPHLPSAIAPAEPVTPRLSPNEVLDSAPSSGLIFSGLPRRVGVDGVFLTQ